MLRLPRVNIAVLKDKILFSYILPAPQAKNCLQFVHHSWPELINIQMHSNTLGTPIELTFRPNMITIIKYRFLMFKACELWKNVSFYWPILYVLVLQLCCSIWMDHNSQWLLNLTPRGVQTWILEPLDPGVASRARCKQMLTACKCNSKSKKMKWPKQLAKKWSMVDRKRTQPANEVWKKQPNVSRYQISLRVTNSLIPFNFITNQPLWSMFSLMSRPPRESFESDLKGESITTSLFAWNRIAGATATALTSCFEPCFFGLQIFELFYEVVCDWHISQKKEMCIYIYIYIVCMIFELHWITTVYFFK